MTRPFARFLTAAASRRKELHSLALDTARACRDVGWTDDAMATDAIAEALVDAGVAEEKAERMARAAWDECRREVE